MATAGTAPSPQIAVSPRKAGLDWARCIQAAVFVATVLLVAAPFVVIAYQSLQTHALYEPNREWTLGNYARLLARPEFYQVLRNSLQLSLVATVVATGVGVSAAIAFARLDLPFRRGLETAMLGPIYLSQLVLAFGWYLLYGPSGYLTLFLKQTFGGVPWNLGTISGMGVLGGIAMAPYVMLYCSSSLSLTNPSLEDAARSTGARPARVLRSVTLPLLRPAIVYSTLLTFVGGLEMLSIPLIFGWPSGLEFFTTFLLREGLGKTAPDYGLLGAASFLLLALVAVFVVVQRRLIGHAQRFVTVRGKAQRPKGLDIGGWRWAVFGAVAAYLVFFVALPLLALVLRSFVQFLTPLVSPWRYLTLSHYRFLFEYAEYKRSIWNSLEVAIIGAALATALIALVAAVIHRSDFRWRRTLEAVVFFPRAMPGTLVGIGFLWITLWVPGMNALHGTIWILIMAFAMNSLPSAYATVAPSFMQIGKELDQSARVSGAGWWTVLVRIVMPIAKPALVACYILLFMAFLKEYAAATFLFGPGGEVIGSEIYHLWAKGYTGQVAALSAIQLLITLMFVVIVKSFGRKGGASWQS